MMADLSWKTSTYIRPSWNSKKTNTFYGSDLFWKDSSVIRLITQPTQTHLTSRLWTVHVRCEMTGKWPVIKKSNKTRSYNIHINWAWKKDPVPRVMTSSWNRGGTSGTRGKMTVFTNCVMTHVWPVIKRFFLNPVKQVWTPFIQTCAQIWKKLSDFSIFRCQLYDRFYMKP